MKKNLSLLLSGMINMLITGILSIVNPVLAHAQTQLTNIPTVFIKTNGGAPVNDKKNYVPAKITIRSSRPSDQITDVVTGIRGRGNSTWTMPKKPYRIKLDKKASLFGLNAKAKSWVLLANYADKTLIRNALALKISDLIELEFTPSVQFVDLYLNDVFLGNYMLTDQVQEGKERVDIEEQPANPNETEITGGYLLEIDGFASSESIGFITNKGLKIAVKYPGSEDINNKQYTYIRNFINNLETRLFSSDFKDPVKGYRSLVDTATLVNWYIGCELSGNPDSFWSTFIYKKRSIDKIFFGPMWDYDIAFNNDNRLGDAVNKLMREYAHAPRTWIEQLWKDEWFRTAVERRWKELLDGNIENALIRYIDETAALLEASQQKNYAKWNTLNSRVYLEYALFPTYNGGINFLKSYVRERIKFLNQKLIIPDTERPTDIFVADNFYYSIMNRRTNNAIDVTDDSVNDGALLMLWEPISGNESQLWKIEAIDNTYFRIINKRSGLVMAANGRGNNLKQTARNNNDDAQKWKITPAAPGGLYGIESALAPDYYSINNSEGSFENGNKVIVWDNRITASENQQWYIAKREMTVSAEKISTLPIVAFKCYVSGNYLNVISLPEDASVSVFNLQGMLIKRIKAVNGQISVKLPQHGIYVVNVQGNKYSAGSQLAVY